MGTPYADSYSPVNDTMYQQVTKWQGHTPYGWGRYFYDTSSLGSNQFYHPATENSFFYGKTMRLLPIAEQSAHIQDDPTNYTLGKSDATSNLKAVLQAFNNDAVNFFKSGSDYWVAFALDCESTNQGNLTTIFTDYLRGWITGMEDGITDSSGRTLKGWHGVYSAQGDCITWQTIVDLYNQYGLRPKFVAMSSYIDPVGTTPPPAFPSWPTDNPYTTTDTVACNHISIGQSTVLW